MRPELLIPAKFGKDAARDSELLQAMFGLVSVTVTGAAMEKWTPLERALAYDWAARVHFSASDSLVRVRDKPSFVAAAEQAAVSEELASRDYGGSAVRAWEGWVTALRESQRPIDQYTSMAIGAAQRAIDELRRNTGAVRSPILITFGKGLNQHQTVREILVRSEGEVPLTGISYELAKQALQPSPETIRRWLEADEERGLVEKCGDDKWRATKLLAQHSWNEPLP